MVDLFLKISLQFDSNEEYMRIKNIILIIIIFLQSTFSIFSETYYAPSIHDSPNNENYACSIKSGNQIDANTSITFNVDSRGDYVDFPFHVEITWRQNISAGGWRIQNLYDHRITCNLYDTPDDRFFDYRTATNTL